MPELAEVEALRYLAETHLLGQTIVACNALESTGGNRAGLFDDKIMSELDGAKLEAFLLGSRVQNLHRKGKYMWMQLSRNTDTDGTFCLVFHFGMTGSLSIRGLAPMRYESFRVDETSWPPKYTKLELTLSDPSAKNKITNTNTKLTIKSEGLENSPISVTKQLEARDKNEGGPYIRIAFTDPRRLGKIFIRTNPLIEPPISLLAPDPLPLDCFPFHTDHDLPTYGSDGSNKINGMDGRGGNGSERKDIGDSRSRSRSQQSYNDFAARLRYGAKRALLSTTTTTTCPTATATENGNENENENAKPMGTSRGGSEGSTTSSSTTSTPCPNPQADTAPPLPASRRKQAAKPKAKKGRSGSGSGSSSVSSPVPNIPISTAPIKSRLLDQQAAVCGLGNWLVDEILYQSCIHPATPTAALTDGDILCMYQNMVHILNVAVGVTRGKIVGGNNEWVWNQHRATAEGGSSGERGKSGAKGRGRGRGKQLEAPPCPTWLPSTPPPSTPSTATVTTSTASSSASTSSSSSPLTLSFPPYWMFHYRWHKGKNLQSKEAATANENNNDSDRDKDHVAIIDRGGDNSVDIIGSTGSAGSYTPDTPAQNLDSDSDSSGSSRPKKRRKIKPKANGGQNLVPPLTLPLTPPLASPVDRLDFSEYSYKPRSGAGTGAEAGPSPFVDPATTAATTAAATVKPPTAPTVEPKLKPEPMLEPELEPTSGTAKSPDCYRHGRHGSGCCWNRHGIDMASLLPAKRASIRYVTVGGRTSAILPMVQKVVKTMPK